MMKRYSSRFLHKEKRGRRGEGQGEERRRCSWSQTHTGSIFVLVFAYGRIGTADSQVVGEKSDKRRLVWKAIFGYEIPARGWEGEEGGKERREGRRGGRREGKRKGKREGKRKGKREGRRSCQLSCVERNLKDLGEEEEGQREGGRGGGGRGASLSCVHVTLTCLR